MIQRISHVTYFVTDQDKAREFYVDKLGFEVKTDAVMDNGFRWLTVAPPGQDIEIVLMKVQTGPMSPFKQEDVDTILSLLAKGVFGAGVMQTPDCRKTYEELKAKGVEFKAPPREQFYGIEAVLKDPFGNWFSMTQPK